MLVYWQHKLSHNGLTTYKVFEGCNRSLGINSLSNLLSFKDFQNETLRYYIEEIKKAENQVTKDYLIADAVKTLTEKDYEILCRNVLDVQVISEATSRKIKKYASKLCYYAKEKSFTSKKSGNYKMKVAFLTLTAPEQTTHSQFNKAFELFLDYLRRTANCVFVWKKELGSKGNQLHAHILINNFIPYYIVSWKWKRLLIAQGLEWPVNEDGKHTESHYRIELPRSRKLVAHYISKYMAKGQEVPKSIGRLWGKSAILDECKEYTFIENDLPNEEIEALLSKFKSISDLFFSHICADLRSIKDIAPTIYEAFCMQFEEFSNKLNMSQKFFIV